MCESPTRCTITDLGLRCTGQREAVLGALRQATDHPTAEELHDRLEGVSLATVYNALAAFQRVGLAQAISVSSSVTRWDGAMALHVHARRDGADIVEDVPDDLASPLLAPFTSTQLAAIGARMGGRVTGVQIKVLLADEVQVMSDRAPTA